MISCQETETVVEPSVSGNLLFNGSFDANYTPSLWGWSISTDDTTIFSFSQDVPPGQGGHFVHTDYSLVLKYRQHMPYGVYQVVPAVVGPQIYFFSFWARNYFNGAEPAQLWLLRGNTVVKEKLIPILADSNWVHYFVYDTTDVELGDWIGITLRVGGIGPRWTTARVVYDDCILRLVR
ncbi:MAG: hypothetical protein ABIJ81_03035 [Patescibacteria group bacterium]